jgi:hypothetical protein
MLPILKDLYYIHTIYNNNKKEEDIIPFFLQFYLRNKKLVK